MYKKEKIIHNNVLEFLEKNPKGLTMTELVGMTKFSRKAIEKHLQILILENEIYMKQFGITKVYYPNHRIQHFDFEKLNYIRESLDSKKQKRYILRKYIYPTEIGFIFKSADLILSRAGANTITEILAARKISLLIPLPHGQYGEQL